MTTEPPDSNLTPELDHQISQAAIVVTAARRVVALTGAGLSVESGIPPFRGPGGLWTKYGEPPMDGYRRFLEDPAQARRDRLNPREEFTSLATLSLRGPAGLILERLLQLVIESQRGSA